MKLSAEVGSPGAPMGVGNPCLAHCAAADRPRLRSGASRALDALTLPGHAQALRRPKRAPDQSGPNPSWHAGCIDPGQPHPDHGVRSTEESHEAIPRQA